MSAQKPTKKKTRTQKKYWGFDVANIDRKVRPADDFYHFANGGWIKKNPIPKTEVMWGSFYTLRYDNRERIHTVLKEIAKDTKALEGSDRAKLRDFYLSGMNEKKIEKDGIKPLLPELEQIESIETQNDLLSTVSYLHTSCVGVLWSSFVDLDEKKSDKRALYIYQDGLGLPEREYYVKGDPKFEDIRKKYVRHISKMFVLTGHDKKEAKTAAEVVMDIETKLAKASMTAVERRNVEKLYNKMSVKALSELAPNIDWKRYFKEIGVKKTNNLIVAQPKFIKAVNVLLKKVSLEDWKWYLKWHLITSTAGLLSSDLAKESFSFYGKTISGLREQKPRWQRVYGVIDSAMSDAVAREYVERYFGEGAKAQVEEMVDDIIAVYRKRIKDLNWMTDATKKRALKKLGTFRKKIGYPEKWRDYSKLDITKDSYFDNALRAARFEYAYSIGKLERPIDRDEWIMDPHTVNACYWPNQNEITFPAGILQPPFFAADADPAINYGAIGAIIGHELTHGFDDQGCLFDEKGNLKNWWTEEDKKQFTKKARVLVKQYNEYTAIDDIKVNGKLTLGENIADLGGVVLGYYAFQKYMDHHGRLPDIDGFTPEQRYFLGVALVECAKKSKEIARLLAVSDPHAPAYTRVNGPLSNMEEFYEAFNVQEGDAMWRPAKERAKIW